MAESKPKITVRDATPSDIPSMTTIVPRAFAPDAFLPLIIPDTPRTRTWWAETYHKALHDPAARLLVAAEEDSNTVVGVLTLHYLGPDSPPNGSFAITAAIPPTEDHSPILAEALVALKKERSDLMGSEPNFLIELVGVDAEFKGLGIGRELTQRACEIADERDAAVYLQTSAARDYYTKKLDLGFEATSSEDDGGTVIRAGKSKRRG